MKRLLPVEVNDVELSERARRGDEDAWRALIRRHTPAVYRIAARMLGAGAEAEDACQEAFMKAHRGFASYDSARPLQTWLARIVYHECLRLLSAPSRRGVASDPSELDRLPHATPERAGLEVGALVQAALGHLSAQDRALVTLRYVDGLTDLEVGEAVGMNRNTVRTRLHRARLILQKVLGPTLGGRTT